MSASSFDVMSVRADDAVRGTARADGRKLCSLPAWPLDKLMHWCNNPSSMSSDNIDVRVVEFGPVTFTDEARSIQTRAARGETAVVRLGSIIFFCANRDAWMLDPEDGFARCLMRDGAKHPLGIIETKTQFAVKWNADYAIQGEAFTYIQRGTTSVHTITGYPIRPISQSS